MTNPPKYVVQLVDFGDLTPRQRTVLITIIAYCAAHQYPPSTREICELMGISSPHGLKRHLDMLVKKGYLKIEPRKARAIQVLEKAKVGANVVQVQ